MNLFQTIRCDCLVIGGGPAGLSAAAAAAESGLNTVLAEFLPSPGRKLLASGSGKCNVTNRLPLEEFARRYQCGMHFVRPALYAFPPEALEKEIVEYSATGLVAVFNDTSNGIVNPIDKMGELSRKHGLLFAVDDVSALACMPFHMDEWKVDAVVTASQKGLMSPVGVSFAALSDRAWKACELNPVRDFYTDFIAIRKILAEKGETPGSTPVSLVMSVHEALNMIYEEGIENVFLRHKAISAGTKAAMEALGFSLYPLEWEQRSDSLTVAKVPAGISAKALSKKMVADYRLKFGTGLGDMGNEYIRIAHMGYCYAEDMLQCISAIECCLDEMGIPHPFGKGTEAFINAYKKTKSEGTA